MAAAWLAAAVLAVLAPIDAASGQAETGLPVRARIGFMSLEAPAGSERRVEVLARGAETILPQLEAELGIHPLRRFRMLLIPPDAPADSEIVALDRAAPEWAAGFYVPRLRVGAIRVAQATRYPYGTLESVLAHETTHVLLHDALDGRLPLWFEEGVATWQGRRWSLQDVLVYSAVLTTDLPSLAELDSSFHASEGEAELAYAASFAFVSRAVRTHGRAFLRDLLRQAGRRPFREAWAAASGSTLEEAEAAWRRESLWRYRWIPILTASSTLWLVITLFAVFAGARKRARLRRAREHWAEEELPEPPAPDEADPENG